MSKILKSDELDRFVISGLKDMPEFQATPIYESRADSLIFYARNVPSHERRLNNLLTLFLSQEDDSLVGIEIKGVRRIIQAMMDSAKEMNFSLNENDEIQLTAMMLFALVPSFSDHVPPDIANVVQQSIGLLTNVNFNPSVIE